MIHPCRDIWIKAADGMAGGDTDPWTEAVLSGPHAAEQTPMSSGLLCCHLSSFMSNKLCNMLIWRYSNFIQLGEINRNEFSVKAETLKDRWTNAALNVSLILCSVFRNTLDESFPNEIGQ